MHRKALLIAMVAIFLSACQALPTHRLHHRVLSDHSLVDAQSRILLLPLKIEVKEMSAGGLSDVVPEWTDQAKRHLRANLLQEGESALVANQQIVELPALSDEERASLEEHVSLAKLVWADAHVLTHFGGPAWAHKAKHFDYGIGPGLAHLADKANADKALIIIGEDVHTTSGRKAMAIGLAALGVAVPLGHTILVGKLVDLRSGDVLWMNTWVSAGDTSLLEYADAGSALRALFDGYPGIAEYDKFADAKD